MESGFRSGIRRRSQNKSWPMHSTPQRKLVSCVTSSRAWLQHLNSSTHPTMTCGTSSGFRGGTVDGVHRQKPMATGTHPWVDTAITTGSMRNGRIGIPTSASGTSSIRKGRRRRSESPSAIMRRMMTTSEAARTLGVTKGDVSRQRIGRFDECEGERHSALCETQSWIVVVIKKLIEFIEEFFELLRHTRDVGEVMDTRHFKFQCVVDTRDDRVTHTRHRNQASVVFYQCDRVIERTLPAGHQGSRPLPLGGRGIEMPISGIAFTGPRRARSGTMDHTVESRAQRVRDHLRRPLTRSRNLLMKENRRNTLHEIDPLQH
jgi:hypothetical protein